MILTLFFSVCQPTYFYPNFTLVLKLPRLITGINFIYFPFSLIVITYSHSLFYMRREAMADPVEKRPTQLINPGTCIICPFPITNQSEMPCGRVACHACIKRWGQWLVIDLGKKEATCPECREPFKTFWHCNGRPYTLFKTGYGANGKLKHPRRVRKRHRAKKNGAAGSGNVPTEAMDFE